jgi:quercetin dioxygenase-like cupin family protein
VNISAIIFDQIEWQSPQTGMLHKVFQDGSKKIRLVEFSREFIEARWCEKAHAGFVLSGDLDIDFSGHVVRFPEGSALLIPPGAAHAHKARAVTPRVRLLLVEEVSA